MAIDYELVGKRIHDARKKKGITQEELAEKLDISVPYISRIERGTTQANLKRFSEICGLLGLTEGELLNGSSSSSCNYLSEDFSNLLKDCPPEKVKLIYDIAKVIVEQ